MVIPVVADADVLFGATTRGLLIHLDYAGVIRLHWSALILDEMCRALVRARRKHASQPSPQALLSRLADDGQVDVAAALLAASGSGALKL